MDIEMEKNKIPNSLKNEEDDLLTVMDILDLDESVVDEKVDKIISKPKISDSDIRAMLVFTKYKHMITAQEDTGCENDTLVNYILKQLVELDNSDSQRFVSLLKILVCSIQLDKEKMIFFIEHIIQQLFASVNSSHDPQMSEEVVSMNIMYLKIIDSMMSLCIQHGFKPDYKFLNSEVFTMLQHKDERLYKEIISTTVPNVIICYEDHNILNIIWDKVIDNIDNIYFNDILTLCTLSDFYFPIKKMYNGYKIDSFIIEDKDFWRLIQKGICNDDASIRKYSNYLAKRAIDHIIQNDLIIRITLENENIPFILYDSTHKEEFEGLWTNFFIIIESLEEKQFYLVDAALNLLPKIMTLHPSWCNCIIRRALMHDTDTVLSKVLRMIFEYHLPDHYADSFPYEELINVLNKTFLYDNFFNFKENHVMTLFGDFIKRDSNFSHFIAIMKNYTLSPIPRFFVSYLFMLMKENLHENQEFLDDYINGYIKEVPYVYNNILLEYGTQCCIANFCISHLTSNETMNDLLLIFKKKSDMSLSRHSRQWNDIVSKIKSNLDESQIREDVSNMSSMLTKCDSHNMKPIIKLMIAYFESSHSSVDLFDRVLSVNMNRLKDCNTRTYASNSEFDSNFFIIVNILSILDDSDPNSDVLMKAFIKMIIENITGISSFLSLRLQNVSSLSDYKLVNQCADAVECFLNQASIAESFVSELQSLTNASIEAIKLKETPAIQKYFSIKIISAMASNIYKNGMYCSMEKNYNLSLYIDALSNMYFLKLSTDDSKNDEDKGSLISSYNHTICRIQYYYYLNKSEWSPSVTSALYEYILDVLEKGGSECLLWPIRLAKVLLENLAKENVWDKIYFMLNRTWKEILQVRKNHQFKECIEEYIKLLYDEHLLAFPNMQELSLEYGNRLFELGEAAPFTVYQLINHMRMQLRHTNLMPFIPIIVKSLIFGTVPRKDQSVSNPYEHIKIFTLDILIHQKENFHADIMKHLQDQIESMCKEKHRYHANSLNHRILLKAFQTLLLIYKINPNISKTRKNIEWSKQILMRQPHHTSIRMILEWYIALQLIYTDKPLKESVDEFELNQLNQVSFFMIIYHVVKHQLIVCQNKIIDQIDILHNFDGKSENIDITLENFNFVMDTYLPFTMGQLFNIRLYAQYLFTLLYKLMKISKSKCKYDMMYATIDTNFKLSADEKNLKRIQSDFYVNKFDIICNLNVCDIYYNIPRLTDISDDEWIKHRNVLFLDKLITQLYLETENSTSGYSYVDKNTEFDLSIIRETLRTSQSIDDSSVEENSGVIQKKFVPWKNMLIDMGLEKKMPNNQNEMVVVASLIDRIPNLGGLSRTCEVFGVKQYVIGSLRHLQDKQFQNLSVSSEKWIDIAEVRPGQDLKNYLIAMKEKGYKIVGAEQTSSSVLLSEFKFPKKIVLLLGNEKEGVPPDLLHMMDYCVEIPQYGVIRSLNVHVTASIFIWEYARQLE